MGKTELYRQLREKEEQARMYYESARGNSKNPLKYPNPKTAEEQQRYFKLMTKADDEAKAIRRAIAKLDEEESKNNNDK